MVYLNNDNNLYYTDAEFTNIASGIVGDILYVNGVPTLYKNNSDGLFYTDQGFTNLANGASGLSGMNGGASNERWFINGQQTGLHQDGSGSWNGKNYRDGEADFTGTYAGGLGLPDGFYVNGVRTTLDLWGGHGVWNNKIYGSNVNETHLNGFTGYIQNNNYGGFTQLTDLTDVDFSSVVSVAGANFTGVDLSGLDFSSFTDFSRVNFYNAKVNNANFSGRNLWGTTPETYVNLGFAEAAGADFSNAQIGEIFGNYSGTNFSNAVFKGDISSTNFAGANLAGADFSDATMNNGNVTFDGATDITGTIFPVNFVGLVNGTWRFGSSVTNLDYAIIQNGDLTGVDFSNVTSMVGARFGNGGYNGEALVDLTGADFSNVTNMVGAYFYGVNLTGASFPSNISGVLFETVNITNISFPNGLSDISNVSFVSDIQFDNNGSDLNLNVDNYSGLSFRYARFKRNSELNHLGYMIYVPANLSLMNVEAFYGTEDEGYNRFRNGETNSYSILDFRLVTNPNNPSIASSSNGLSFKYANLSSLDSSITYLYSLDLRGTTLPSDISGKTFYNCVFSVPGVGNEFGSPTNFGSVANMDNVTFDSIYPDMSGLDFSNVTTATGLQFLNGTTYTGIIDGTFYVNGQLLTGRDEFNTPSTGYYINGLLTPLNESGHGYIDGILHISGQPNPIYTGPAYTYYYAFEMYYINGVAKSGLDQNGNGFSSDKAYYYAVEQPTGWNSYYYYINNVQTLLNEYGNGFWDDIYYNSGQILTGRDWEGGTGYYINGLLTDLDLNGTGFWQGKAYQDGAEKPNGYVSGLGGEVGYFINHVLMPTLNSGGHGYIDGVLYISGQPNPTYTGPTYHDWGDFSVFYINGLLTELDESGNGTSGGLYYVSGVLFSGYDENSGIYYVGGQATELDSTGNGTYNGQTYVNGVVQNGGGGNNLPPNYKGEWDNYTDYGQDDVVSLNNQYWILSGLGGWTVGGAPGLGYGWTRYGASLVRVSGRGRFFGRVKFAV